MKDLHRKHHWLGRILASDPGKIRLHKAARATISLIASVFTTLFILRTAGLALFTPAIVSGVVGMLGIMVVLDDTYTKKKLTTLLLGISAMIGITLGSFFAGNSIYIDVLLILSIFSSFYLTRFGVRYFSLFMIGFITVYFSSVLKLTADQIPWFFMGIWIGVGYAFLINFILFQATAKNLKRGILSFHIQSNLTFNILIKGIQENGLSEKERENLRKHVLKLREYAIVVSGYIKDEDIHELWPGLRSAELRLYVFDTGMLIETLADSIQRLKNAEALEIDELRRLLVWVMETLRDAEVLAHDYQNQNLQEAELAVQSLRLLIIDLFNSEEKPEGWLFLIRRIESIANHVIEGALTIQQSLLGKKDLEFENELSVGSVETEENNYEKIDEAADHVAGKESDESVDNKDQGLKPSTKKAYQALVASILSIIAGQFLSPGQPYWVLLTAYIVLLGTESIGRIYTKGVRRSLGTVAGAVIGFVMAKMLSGQSVLEVFMIFVVVFLAFYFIETSYTLMSVFITMMIAFMYDLLLGGITFTLMNARILDTVAGAAIAFAVSMVIFPKKTTTKVSETINDYFEDLNLYVAEYVRSFTEEVNVKELSERGINLDNKLKTIMDEAETLLHRPGSPSDTTITRWITVMSAINYYAKHLVASSYRKGFDYPEHLLAIFKQIEEKLEHNIELIISLLKGEEKDDPILGLENEREQIERLAPTRTQSQQDLIHHLYYVWRINKSLVELGMELNEGKK
ncbi:FUSC family protein [Heyndrickxia sp. MSNUG]|uniref:FUSC family protein n=1 Tax=Heyndrickxia sp. MSNUG TaxID=3136677 RepID=UPI003C2ECB2A